MKKLIVSFAALFVFASVHAESSNEPLIDRSVIISVINICSILLVMYIIINFILGILQRNFDYRIKNKVIDAGASEAIATQVLRTPDKKKVDRKTILQWICVLLALGVGCSIVNVTMPIGLHSVAIMAFSIAAGLLAYYLISARTKIIEKT